MVLGPPKFSFYVEQSIPCILSQGDDFIPAPLECDPLARTESRGQVADSMLESVSCWDLMPSLNEIFELKAICIILCALKWLCLWSFILTLFSSPGNSSLPSAFSDNTNEARTLPSRKDTSAINNEVAIIFKKKAYFY